MVKDRGVWEREAPLGEALGGGRRGGFRVRWGRRETSNCKEKILSAL